jgi:tripartite ATP-independent transporter DctM subunit
MSLIVLSYIGIIIALLFFLLATGTWISFALYGTALFALMFLGRGDMQGILGSLLFNSLDSYTLVSLPLFVLMGEILIKSGCSDPLFRGVRKILSPFPGGMLHANILACSIFAACSGSSTATTVAIGGVSYPEMMKYGYNRKITLGSICAGGTLGILIPPSIMMILYGSITGNSVGRLFIGGIFPGLTLAGLFMAWIVLASVLHPEWMPKRDRFGRDYPLRVLSGLLDLWPIAALIALIMISIYGGFATPTEAAAVATVVSFLLAALYYRKMSWKILAEAMKETIFLTALLMLSIIGARALGMALSMLQIATALSQFVASLPVNRYVIWAIIVLIYALLGCLIDGIDLLVVTTPVFYPIITKTLGFDPIWFGVVFVVLLEMSLITPPVGFNLYVTHSITGGKDLQDTIKGMLPFFIAMLACIAILTIFPSIVMYLPSRMGR